MNMELQQSSSGSLAHERFCQHSLGCQHPLLSDSPERRAAAAANEGMLDGYHKLLVASSQRPMAASAAIKGLKGQPVCGQHTSH